MDDPEVAAAIGRSFIGRLPANLVGELRPPSRRRPYRLAGSLASWKPTLSVLHGSHVVDHHLR